MYNLQFILFYIHCIKGKYLKLEYINVHKYMCVFFFLRKYFYTLFFVKVKNWQVLETVFWYPEAVFSMVTYQWPLSWHWRTTLSRGEKYFNFNSSFAPDMYKTETINIYCRLILAPVKLTPSNSFSLELADMVSISAFCCNPED